MKAVKSKHVAAN